VGPQPKRDLCHTVGLDSKSWRQRGTKFTYFFNFTHIKKLFVKKFRTNGVLKDNSCWYKWSAVLDSYSYRVLDPVVTEWAGHMACV